MRPLDVYLPTRSIGFDLMERPSLFPFSFAEKQVIRTMHRQEHQNQIQAKEDSAHPANNLLDCLIVDFFLAKESLINRGYSSATSWDLSSSSSSTSSSSLSSSSDFFSIDQKKFEDLGVCIVNSGLARRHGTSSSSFFFATRWRNATRRFRTLQKPSHTTKYQSIVEKLHDSNFRSYMNQAKIAWHGVQNMSELTNFYANYPQYDPRASYYEL